VTRKNKNSRAAISYAQQAYELSEKLNYEEGKLSAIYELARNYRLLEQLDSARYYTDAHIAMAAHLDNLDHYSKGVYQKGVLLLLHSNTDSAIIYYRYALNGFKKLNNTFYLFAIYNELGSLFQEIASYDSAIVYYHKAMDIGEKNKYNNISEVYCNIGKVYYKKEEENISIDSILDLSLAKKYLSQSLANLDKSPDPNLNTKAIAYNNLGNVANHTNHLDSALMFYSIADSIFTLIGSNNGAYNVKINIGIVYRKQKNLAQAEKLFLAAMNYYDNNQLTAGRIIARRNLAIVRKMQSKYSEAIDLYKESLRLTYESKDRKNRLEIYKQLSDIFQERKNFEEAFRYLSFYLDLKDSIYSITKDKIIIELQEKYNIKDTEAKYLTEKKENLENEIKIRRQATYLIITIGFIILLAVIIIYIKNVSHKNKIIADQKIKQLEEEKKLLAARSIVVGQEQERKRIAKELHDGLGVLLSTAKMQFTTIKDKSPENRPLIEKAGKLLEQAAGDVRKISHNMMPGLLTRYGFYEAVEDLFEQLDDMHGLTASASISGDQERLPENTEIMLYRIVQEMANNTLKHAEATVVHIDIVILPEQMSIDFSDNGKGFDVEQELAKKSIGLTSIRSRVNFLNGNLDIRSKPGEGVNYHIIIPIGNKAEV
jgi:signal transduction histidine kinase